MFIDRDLSFGVAMGDGEAPGDMGIHPPAETVDVLQREEEVTEGPLLPNPFERARVDHESRLIALLGSDTTKREDVPAELLGDYDRFNQESPVKRIWEIATGLQSMYAKYPSPDHDDRLEGDAGRTFSRVRYILRTQLKTANGPYSRGAMIGNLAIAEADLYKIDHGSLNSGYRASIMGELIAYEWLLGRRESLDPVTAEPHPIHPRILVAPANTA